MGICARWGGFERNKGGSREKWRSFERKSACIFEWSGGGNENQLVLLGCALSFLCSTLAF